MPRWLTTLRNNSGNCTYLHAGVPPCRLDGRNALGLSSPDADPEPPPEHAQEKVDAAVSALEQQLQELDRRVAAREEEEQRMAARREEDQRIEVWTCNVSSVRPALREQCGSCGGKLCQPTTRNPTGGCITRMLQLAGGAIVVGWVCALTSARVIMHLQLSRRRPRSTACEVAVRTTCQ